MSNDKSFIEVQFPVSKVSKESYKERKAGSGQTLTGLGKWWGRKPLILVRATILGLLLPASNDPKKDREIFLKLLTMDEAGFLKRKSKSIPPKVIYEKLTINERRRYFKDTNASKKIEYIDGTTVEIKQELQNLAFKRMSYDEKLTYCVRPEEVNNIDLPDWEIINNHLGTNVYSFKDLINELGRRKYQHNPIVGDCFSGGGSIPYEALKIGCDTFASDLNPISMLLTWAALNILNTNKGEIDNLRKFQEKIYNLADEQITNWGIEHNEMGHRANSYLYCNETLCPECGYKVPLSPSWIIGKGTKTIAVLVENTSNKSFDIEIITDASNELLQQAEQAATVIDYNLVCPHCKVSTPIPSIRKDKDDGVKREYRYNIPNSLRKWGKNDFISSNDDIFQERLFCIRYEETIIGERGNPIKKRYYTAPTKEDLNREHKVIELLKDRFDDWQKMGYIPDREIESGWNTNQLTYERGWCYWHQLFNPRQLLMNGLLLKLIDEVAKTSKERVLGLLSLNKCCDRNSKLCRWDGASEKAQQVFYNQALNTLFNYVCRGFTYNSENLFFDINNSNTTQYNNSETQLRDARTVKFTCDIWITDPPYADAVNYHELSEFFLAWDKKILLDTFPEWYADSKRVIAVKGTGETFNNNMIAVYKNLANHMSKNGVQVVMFTHQDVSVWAELTMILWSAGLRVTAAWNIATETDASGIKRGNYVKGTVLLVLRKQISEETVYLDELYPEVEDEVKRQIDNMRDLDDKEDPNFTDADYLLAAYAASLKVLTSYKQIEDIDVKYELSKERIGGEESPIERIINEAVKIAYDYLIPSGFDQFTWKLLTPEERFYIKGLDLEKDRVYQVGAYQELARGFGVREYKDLLASAKANEARLKTALEFGMRGLGDSDRFGSSVLRNILAALHQSIKEEDTSKGRNWLKNELPNYWQQRNTIIEILDYISTLGNIENMGYWEQEANYARLLCELIRNDGV